MEEIIINKLYKLCLKASKKEEVPVSAIIVDKNKKIIAKAYNKKNIKNNPLLHAEIICIEKACNKLKSWNLSGCNMYVTLEPCNMCKEIINESRINNVFYILPKESKVYNKFTIYEQMYYDDAKFSNLIKSFFKNIR